MIPHQSIAVLGKKIAFSTLVQYAGKAAQIVLAAVSLKLISNFLSESEYGLYGAITEYALFFSVAANLGIFATVVKKMADDPLSGKIFFNSLALRMLTGGVFFAVAVLILLIQGNYGVFFWATLLFLGALLCDFITSVCDGMLQANYWMGRATAALVAGKILSFFGVYALIRLGLSADQTIPLLFGATLAGSLLTALISFWLVYRQVRPEWQFDPTLLWTILKASLPFGIINILNNLYFRFLPDYFGHQALSEAQFGTFNISFRVAQVISLFSTFLMFSALPGLKQYIDRKEWREAGKLYRRLLWVLMGCGIVVFMAGSALGPFILELLTHKKYFLPELWFVLPMMLFLAAVSYGYDLMLISLFALEQERWFLKRELAALAVALIFFGISWLAPGVQLKIFFIIFGAIAGEVTMVILGSFKLRHFFGK